MKALFDRLTRHVAEICALFDAADRNLGRPALQRVLQPGSDIAPGLAPRTHVHDDADPRAGQVEHGVVGSLRRVAEHVSSGGWVRANMGRPHPVPCLDKA